MFLLFCSVKPVSDVLIVVAFKLWCCYNIFIGSTAPTDSASPVAAPVYHFPASTSLSPPSKGHHSNLTLILGIGAGFFFIAILFVLIICLCTSRRGKTEAPPLVAGTYIKF